MNRRKLLSLIGATALTPVIPPQVFASGGIVNPDHCGFIGEMASDFVVPHGKYVGIDPISMFVQIIARSNPLDG